MPGTWVPIAEFPEFYEVSDLGRVRSLHFGKVRILKPGWANGYPMVLLHVGGVQYKRYVHRLVAEAFLDRCPEGQEVRHLDGDRRNPAKANLSYGTHGENEKDKVQHGTHPWASQTHCANGHEFNEENSYWNGKQRVCRACRSQRVAEWNARNPGYTAAYRRSKRQRRGQWRASKTHCKRGHEYTPENTIAVKGGTRRCRACKNEDSIKYRESRKTG